MKNQVSRQVFKNFICNNSIDINRSIISNELKLVQPVFMMFRKGLINVLVSTK